MKTTFSKIILFTNEIKNSLGGMEIHRNEFLKRCNICITKENNISIYRNKILIKSFANNKLINILKYLLDNDSIVAFFFNDLSFISQIKLFREHFPDIKFILRSGGNDILRAPIGNDIIPLQDRQCYIKNIINECITYLIVNSDFSYHRNIKLGIQPTLMKKIRGGASCTIINKKELQSKIKDRLNCPKDKIILLFACRMKKFKGIIEFLNSFFKINFRDSFFIIFIGDGDILPEIKQFIINNNFINNTCFLGECPNNITLYYIACADYLISSSIEERRYFGDEYYIHTETMGRSMIEAIYNNTPIIATNVGGTKEIFLETKNAGLIFNSFDELPSILTKCKELKNSLPIIKPDYSWEKVFLSYEFLINDNKTNVIVMDLDGTLINESTNLISLKQCFLNHTKNYIFILNTARNEDEELIELSNYLEADYLISSNGLKIYSPHNNYIGTNYNDISDEIITQIDSLYLELSKERDFEIKKTHPHIIQIKNKEGISLTAKRKIYSKLDTSFYNTNNNGYYMKIYSKYMNKDAALNFILKNLGQTIVYAAGNGLNDINFVTNADYGWLSSNLKNIVQKSDNIYFFNEDEIGEVLIKKILLNLK